MIISTTKELRFHIPSIAIDEISTLQGILDNSEKDFLRDKLGTPLYNRLCEYYKQSVTPDDFFLEVTNGTYAQHPWNELLLNAQRMVANDAMSRYAYQQILSVNGTGVNIASSNDYDPASEKLLDKGVAGYKKEAMITLNNLLLLLENWAKLTKPSPISVQNTDDNVQKTDEDVPTTGDSVQKTDENVQIAEIEEIVNLWQQSNYFYLHHDLIIPTCAILQQYLDVYENRDKFIRLLPDLRFIQEEYVEDAFGEDFISEMLQADDRNKLLKKTRRLIVALLTERTSIIAFDKQTRQQAHDAAISLRDNILRLLTDRKAAEQAEADTTTTDTDTATTTQGYQNNQDDSRIFVSPLLY